MHRFRKDKDIEMSKTEIKTVESKQELKAFVQFYYDLYRGSEYAVPFLRFDEMNVLDRNSNTSFEFCDAQYFLALRDGKVVGRVAAIINKKANADWGKKQVRFGWFDFVDDVEVSDALLKAVERYGREKGMTEMAGPLGFTDMDKEGMLIEGFDKLSTMYVYYNYPYYPRHIDAIGGFEKDNDWMEYRIKVPEVTPAKFAKTAEMIERRYNLHAHKFSRKELLQGGLGRRIFEILNETYAHLYDFQQLSERQIDQLVNDYIKIADLNLVVGIVDANVKDAPESQLIGGRLIGFGISFPSFSRALQKTHDGSLWPLGWWHVLRVLKWHKTDTVDLLLIGVLPDYRQKGANALIFSALIEKYREYGFKWAEAMPMMESNTQVRSQWQYLESEIHRVRRCYKKML